MNLKTALLALLISALSLQADLLNVDFGDGQGVSGKTGFAATGETAGDFWNFYTRSNPDGTWKTDGYLPNLKYANGLASGVNLSIYDGPGCWATVSSDPMYHDYIYALDGGQTSLALAGLQPGSYDFYLYGADSRFDLQVGNINYGTKVSFDPVGNAPPWIEGQQYVLFSNIPVGASETALVYLGPGQTYPAGIISGLQVQLVPEPSSSLLLGSGLLLGARRWRKRRAAVAARLVGSSLLPP